MMASIRCVSPQNRIKAPNNQNTLGKGMFGFFFTNRIRKNGITKYAAQIAVSEQIYSQPWNSVHIPQCHRAGQLSALNSFSKNSVICSIVILFWLITYSTFENELVLKRTYIPWVHFHFFAYSMVGLSKIRYKYNIVAAGLFLFKLILN